MRGYGVIGLVVGVVGAVWYVAAAGGPMARRTMERNQLMCAAERGDYAAAKALIAEGAARRRAPGAGELTPLHAAAWRHDVEMVRLLIAGGAGVNECTRSDRTPLMAAADVSGNPGAPAGEVVRLLLRAGARAESRDEWGRTALDIAVARRNLAAARALRGDETGSRGEGER